MNWIKRNVMLVIGGTIALILLLGGVGYLLAGMAEHNRVSEELETAKSDLERLLTASPSPIDENVKLVADDQDRLTKLLAQARSRFASVPVKKLDIAAFKKLLDDTIFELTRDAEAAKVRLPTERYNFTFEIQKSAVSFASGSVQPLSARLGEIKAICKLLYNARVHSIDGMRRVVVSSDDREGSADYLIQRPTTNELAKVVRIPYEVTFSGFSHELALVMDSLAKAPEFFVVRDVWVSPAPVVAAPVLPTGPVYILPTPGAVVPQRPPNPCPDAASDNASDCCTPKPVPQPGLFRPVVVAPRPTSNAVLNERLLRFTLSLEVIVPVSASTTSVSPGSVPAAPNSPGEPPGL